MTRLRAALGSILFLVVAPGFVGGLVPYWLTGWESSDPPLALVVAGALLVAAGSIVLLHAFARFVLEGIGTPAPIAPTAHLVVGGAYRYVRNPMYLAVGSVILGQALLLGQTVLLAWVAGFGLMVEAFVRLYEEPTLTDRYGAEYTRYCETVPRWRPRLRRLPSELKG
jgi:protein-S-isoprenylcysteine O-methyltransferase Ste14